MKKHFATTRILSGLLSAAMVVTMAPQTALSSFAAEPILMESAGGEEDSAIFDGVASEGNLLSEDEADAFDYYKSTAVWFENIAANATAKDIKLYDYPSADGTLKGTPFSDDHAVITAAFAYVSNASGTGHGVHADYDNGYSFVVEPDAGKVLKGNIIKELDYKYYADATASAEDKKLTAAGTDWTIQNLSDTRFNRGSKLVTITPAALAEVYKAGRQETNGNITGREIKVVFESTLTEYGTLTIPVKNLDGTVPLAGVDDSEFVTSTGGWYILDLAAAVKDLANYDLTSADFLAVQVLDADGKIKNTKKQVGITGGDRIVSVEYTGAADDLSTKLKDASNITDLGTTTTDWVAYVKAVSGTEANNVYDYGEAHNAATNPSVAKDTLWMTSTTLQTIYNAGYTARVVVSKGTTAASLTNAAVTYTDKASGYVDYGAKNGAGTGTAPTSVALTGADLEFSVAVKSSTNGRKIRKVYYTNGTNAEDEAVTAGTAGEVSGNVKVDDANITASPVAIRTETDETVVLAGDGAPNVSIFGTDMKTVLSDGTGTSRAVTGQDYKFIVIPKSGANYVVKTVEYAVGNGSRETAELKDGIYTAKNVTDRLTIYVTTGTINEGYKSVNVVGNDAEGYDNVTVKDRVDSPVTVTKDSATTAAVGKPYYFTVARNATGTKINKVFYNAGNSGDIDLTRIAYDETPNGTDLYMIPDVKDNMKITVLASLAANTRSVVAYPNDRVKYSFAKPGGSVTASLGENFSFQVEPADSTTTKILSVGYYYSKNTLNAAANPAGYKAARDDTSNTQYVLKELGTSGGSQSFTIPADILATSPIVVYAITEEEVADGYRWMFDDSAVKSRMTSTYSSTTKNADTLTGQSLDMVLTGTPSDLATSSIYLYDDYNKVYTSTTVDGVTNPIKLDGTSGASQRNAVLDFALAEGATEGIVTIKDAIHTDGSERNQIVAKKAGSTKLTAVLKIDDNDTTRGCLNRLVYTGNLDVTVKELYTDLKISKSSDAFYPSTGDLTVGTNSDKYVKLTLQGVDGQTGKDVDVAVGSDITKVEWKFDPDTEGNPDYEVNHQFDHDLQAANRKQRDSSNADNYTYVVAKKVTTSDIKVQAMVTYADKTTKTVSTTVKCVTAPKETSGAYFMVTRVDGGFHVDNYVNTGSYSGATNGRIAMGLSENDTQSVNLHYDVYYDINGSTGLNFVRGTTTQADLDAAIESGEISLVESGVNFTKAPTFALFDNSNNEKIDTKKYITVEALEGTTGSYRVSSKIAPATATDYIAVYTPEITVNGVLVPALNPAGNGTRADDVRFAIASRQDKTTVNLSLYDSVTKTVDGESTTTVTEYKLSDAYIGKRPYSLLQDDQVTNKETGLYTYGKTTGGSFLSVPKYSGFRLPTADEVAEIGTANTNRVLVGFQAYTSINDHGIADTAGTTYYAPGDYVDVADAPVYLRAVWADKYGIAALTNGNIAVDGTDDYDATKTIPKYDTELGDMVQDGVIPVVLKVTEHTVVDKTNGTATPKVKGKSKYITDGFTLANKYDLTKNAITITNPADGGQPTITGANMATKNYVGVTATWDSGNGVLTADSKDFHVNAAPTFTLALNKESVNLKAGQDPTSAAATVTATLTGAGGPVTLSPTVGDANYYGNFSFSWTNASEADALIATAKTGEKDNALTSYISALKAADGYVELTLTAANTLGQKASDTLKVYVAEPDVTIKLYDTKKMEMATDIFEAQAKKTDTTNQFLVKAFDKTGTDITMDVSWSISVPDGADDKAVDNTAQAALQTSGTDISSMTDGSKYKKIAVATKNAVDTGKLTVKATRSGTTYSHDVTVNTYYVVQLTTAEGAKDPATFITKGGALVKDADEKSVNVLIPLGVDKKIPDAKVASKFSFADISLSGYGAKYVNTAEGAERKIFDHWEGPNSVEYTASIAELVSSDFTNGAYEITPVLFSDISITGIPGSITVKDDEGTTINSSKSYNIEVEPMGYDSNHDGIDDTNETIVMKSTKIGFFQYGAGVNGVSPTAATGTDKITLTDNAAGTKLAGKLVISKVSNKSGVATLTFYAEGSTKAIATTQLYVDGLDVTDGVCRYYDHTLPDGILKNGMKTVNGVTYYFDEAGEQITEAGIKEIDGAKVLFLGAGNVAEPGLQNYDNHNYYVGENGVILTGWIGKDGKTATVETGLYYASAAEGDYGQLVSGKQEVDGKSYYFAPMGSKKGSLDISYQMQRAAQTTGVELTMDGAYYVNAAGEVAMKGIFKVAGIDRLFKEEGTIVTYSDTDVDQTTGEITVANVKYIINKADNSAKLAERFYMATAAWTWSWGTSDPQNAEEAVARRTAGNEPTAKVAITLKGENGTDDKLEYDATTAVKVAVEGQCGTQHSDGYRMVL